MCCHRIQQRQSHVICMEMELKGLLPMVLYMHAILANMTSETTYLSIYPCIHFSLCVLILPVILIPLHYQL